MTVELDPRHYGDLYRFVSEAERLNDRTERLRRIAGTNAPTTVEELTKLISEAEALLADAKALEVFYFAYHGDGDFVGTTDIAKHLRDFLDSYPSARITNPRAYILRLVEEIYQLFPDRVTLELALRALLRANKSPPTVAAVVQAVDAQEKATSELMAFFALDYYVDLGREKLAQMQPAMREAAE